ncbi:MAG TPA: NAD-dependent epimerase/dehydratase family protein [Longimicrobiales bacterium]|nr:NAD-dependent epimerase/dehydratase family protein [Longimicrobiales bacterium]
MTGGAGFVGTNLAHRLASDGHHVLVYDDLSRPGVDRNLRWLRRNHPDAVEVQIGSVTDAARLARLVRRADAVFQLAAQVAVTTSVKDPVGDFAVNLRGTLNLLEAVRASPRPAHVVFTSTNKVYGSLADVRVRDAGQAYAACDERYEHGVAEDRPLDFHSPYGCSKGGADQYVLDYARTFAVPTTVFRMSCIYGPHQHGNEDQGWVAHFLTRVLRGEPITIYGDGKQVRDVLYVADLVEAFLRVLAHGRQVAGRAFNVGGGPERAVSLLQLLRHVEEVAELPARVRFEGWRTGDQRWYVSDTRAFREATGWTARVGTREGVRRLHQWLRRHAPLPEEEAVASSRVAAAG